MQREDLLSGGDRVHEVVTALQHSGMLVVVGDIYQRTGRTDRAMESYRKGHAYAKAIELARLSFPAGIFTQNLSKFIKIRVFRSKFGFFRSKFEFNRTKF